MWLFKTEININTKVCIFGSDLKIRYRSFSVYLAIDRARKKVFKAGIGWLDNIKPLKCLLMSLSKEINIKKVKPNRTRTELQP